MSIKESKKSLKFSKDLRSYYHHTVFNPHFLSPSFKYLNTQGIKQFNQSNFTKANNLFTKTEMESSRFKHIAKNNISIIDYTQQNYTHARTEFETTRKYCDQKNFTRLTM